METGNYSLTRDLLSRLDTLEDELRESKVENATLKVRLSHMEKENTTLKTHTIQRKQIRKMMDSHLTNIAHRLEQSLEEPIIDGEYSNYIHLPTPFCQVAHIFQQQKRNLYKTKEELKYMYYSISIVLLLYCVMYLLTNSLPIQ